MRANLTQTQIGFLKAQFMRKLEILIRNAKNHFNQIQLLSVVKATCVVLVAVIFLVCKKDWVR